jgi:hypothetical protein
MSDTLTVELDRSTRQRQIFSHRQVVVASLHCKSGSQLVVNKHLATHEQLSTTVTTNFDRGEAHKFSLTDKSLTQVWPTTLGHQQLAAHELLSTAVTIVVRPTNFLSPPSRCRKSSS